jgi:hypothetical protein
VGPQAAHDPRLERVPHLVARRNAIEGDLARLTQLYAQPIKTCKAAREWRRRGWRNEMPAAVERVVRLAKRPANAPRIATGVGRPDHRGYCDRVFLIIAPEEAFCG